MESTYGIISLIPIVLTITLAILSRNVIVSLFVGVFSGVLFIVGGNPITATTTLIQDYMLEQLLSSYNAAILILLVFIGGFVTLVEKSGGAEAFNKSISKFINSRRKTQLSPWIGGIAVFFSDLGTPLIVGPIFSPLFKKMRVSKEKLAWILDTTASPVAILVPFIGWGVYSMGLIQTELDALNITRINDWTAFINAIPFQFYAILSLIMVPIVAFTGREFGAMAEAEKKADKGIFNTLDDEKNNQQKEIKINDNNASPLVIVIPLIVLFVTLFGLLAPYGFPFEKVAGSLFRIALMTGYLFAAIVMILLLKFYNVMNFKEGIKTYLDGTGKLFNVIIMLILAWSLSSVGDVLGTSNYVVQLADGTIPAWSVPAIIFFVGSLTSFSTGSSWGTFAIIMPIAIPMAVTLGAPLYVAIAAVLSGGLFGDHCTPISDTTILAATGANCNLIDHVLTQLPYALIVGGVSIVAFIIAGFYESILVTFISIILLYVVYTILSKLMGVKMENYKIEDIQNLES